MGTQIDAQFDFNDSILFSQNSLGASMLDASLLQEEPGYSLSTVEVIEGVKCAKLNEGKLIKLYKKRQKRPDQTNASSEESMHFLNMDDLFRKVERRKVIRSAHGGISLTKRLSSFSENVLTEKIWTEKYRPQKFLDLCSGGNDRPYRLIMQWMKKWSSAVFGEDIILDNVDSLGRPRKKILLLAGPPGIGKTAAVDVIARHLGYKTQELNASNTLDVMPLASADAKNHTFASLKLRIMNSLTTNSVNSSGKPNCLIIDEIDSSVNSGDIVKILNEIIVLDQRAYRKKLSPSLTNAEENKGSSKQKKNQKEFLLNRPIICIANDLYSSSAKAMEKLRPICEIINLRKPNSSHGKSKRRGNASKSVKDHLMWISKKEKLNLDYQEINEIYEICEGDIRACINHLQFNGPRILFIETSLKETLYKDLHISWFSLTNLLFQREHQITKEENFNKMLNLVMNGGLRSGTGITGSFDKVLKGCFNLYLDAVYRQDDSLTKPEIFSDWLYFYDVVQESQDTFYSGAAALKSWSLFSTIEYERNAQDSKLIPNVRNIEFEAFEHRKENLAVVKSVTDHLPPGLRMCLGNFGMKEDSIACQFIPYLFSMLSLRITHNLRVGMLDFEKRNLEKVTSLIQMLKFRLEVIREVDTGSGTLHFAPNIDLLTLFEGSFFVSRSKQMQRIRHTLFPMIKLEIERLTMAENELKKRRHSNADAKEVAYVKKARTSNVEFFKGKYDTVSSQIVKPPKTEVSRIWIKYKEGFSNAVRRNVGWNDLWS